MTAKITKSPIAPSRSLGSCFDDAMKLFDVFPNASFKQAQIASVLKYSATSGPFKSLLSDMKQYGLIEKDDSGEFAVSTALKEFDLASDTEKKAIKYSFATNPKVFSQIIENQGHHIPDTTSLTNILIVRFRFNKAKAAKTAKALRDSLEWADAIDEKGNVLEPKKPDRSNRPSPASNGETDGLSADEAFGDFGSEAQNTSALITDVPIGEGRIVRVHYPQNMTAEEASKVGKVLIALSE